MSEFNRMTVVAAAQVISSFRSHSDMEVLEVQWGIAGRCRASGKPVRVADWARIACEEEIEVFTEGGRVHLSRAMVEAAISAPEHMRHSAVWKKLVAGLRFDGFEVPTLQEEAESDIYWLSERTETTVQLVRMLPSDVPELDFREAESEVLLLLDQHGFIVAKGHLTQAISAFSAGSGHRPTENCETSMRATSTKSPPAWVIPAVATARQNGITSAAFSRHSCSSTTTSGTPTTKSRNTFRG